MPRKCSVYKCRTGYDSQRDSPVKISVYGFPKAKEQCNAWLARLPNSKWITKVTSNMGVCALHFPPDTPMLKIGRYQVPAVPPSIFTDNDIPFIPDIPGMSIVTPTSATPIITVEVDRKPEVERALWQAVHNSDHDERESDDQATRSGGTMCKPSSSTTLDMYCGDVKIKQEVDDVTEPSVDDSETDVNDLRGDQSSQDSDYVPELQCKSEDLEEFHQETSQAERNDDNGLHPYSSDGNVYSHESSEQTQMRTLYSEHNSESRPAVYEHNPGMSKNQSEQEDNHDLYICGVCHKSFKTTIGLKVHIKSHIKPYVCNACGKAYHCESRLEAHEESHKHRAGFKCHVCDRVFRTECEVRAHMAIHIRPFKCLICGKGFPQACDLRAHHRTHSGEKPYECPVCHKFFSSKSYLKAHNLIHLGVKPNKCPICHKCFSNSNYLKIHNRTHTGERPYKCTDCFWAFKDKQDLNRHRLIHTNERPHKCDICSKTFRGSYAMKTHRKLHDAPGGLKRGGRKSRQNGDSHPFHCDECNKVFARQLLLDIHKRRHRDERPFCCDECGRRFFSNRDLNSHKETHLEVKPYQCEVCHKTFAKKNYLQRHGVTHSDDRHYKCEVCHKAFKDKCTLNKHVKIHQRE